MDKTLTLKTNILFAIFITALIAANLLGTKISFFFTESLRVSVGILSFPILFLITDIIAEVHGKQKVKELIYLSCVSLLLVFILVSISVAMPGHSSREDFNTKYDEVFGSSIRIMIASFLAFVIAQFHDLYAFEFWKKQTKGKFLWLRNNLSTVVSQFIDTTIFMFIAFYGIGPFDLGFTFSLIIPYWLFKVTFALIDTPFCYLGVWWLRPQKSKNP